MRRNVLLQKALGFKRRVFTRQITVTNNEASALTGYQVCIEFYDLDFLQKADRENLILALDDGTVLPYWVEEWRCYTGLVKIWTKLDLSASESKVIKLFYGGDFDNPPNGDDVFEFFDDFDGDSLDSSKWPSTGNASGTSTSVENSQLRFHGTSTGSGYSYVHATDDIFSGDFELIARARSKSTSSNVNQELKLVIDSDNWFTAAFRDDSGTLKWRKQGQIGGSNQTTYMEDRYKTETLFKTRRSGSNATSFYWDGFEWQEIGSVYTGFSTNDASVTIGSWYDSAQSQEVFWDWVFAKKYTSNEPSVDVGDETTYLVDTYSKLSTIRLITGNYTQYVRQIQITNNESSALSNFQIDFYIGGDFPQKADPNNLVILDGDTQLPYWVEEWDRNGGRARIWTKVNLAASETKYLYLFYGGPSGVPPNGDDVFEFFDDFTGDELNTSKWSYNNNGTLTIENSQCKLETGTTNNTSATISATPSLTLPLVFGCRKMAKAWGSGDDRSATIRIYDSGENNAIHCTLFRTSSNEYRIANLVSGSWNSQISLASSVDLHTYYRLKITFDGSNVEVKLYSDTGVEIGSHTFSSFSFTPANIYVESRNAGSTTNCKGWFDYLMATKYTTNSPSVTVGSEQSLLRVW